MSYATIVIAHRSPAQILRLVRRLAGDPVLLHINVDAPEAIWRPLADAPDANLELLPRHRSGWGSWGIVEAMFSGAEAALRHDGWTHTLLVTGQDYPLRSPERLAEFLDAHADDNFLPNWSLPFPPWGRRGGFDRIHDINRHVAGRRVRIRWRRRVPSGLVLTGGSMNWALTRPALEQLLELRRTRPEWIEFLSGCWIPDELTVPSLLRSAGVPLINENLSFIRWSNPGAPHPDFLRLEDAEQLRAAADGPSSVGGSSRAKLFARKFDVDQDPRILDWIDGELLDR